MRIAVMGSGGVDGYFGARLVRAGFDVTFITQGEHLAAIRREGLRYGAHWASFALAKSTRLVSRPVMQGSWKWAEQREFSSTRDMRRTRWPSATARRQT